MDARAPEPPIPSGRRKSRRRVALVALAGLLILVGLEAVRALSPPAALRQAPMIVEVPPRHGLRDVARLFERHGVIRSSVAFTVLAILRGSARSLKAGEYEIPRGASLLTVLELLELGKVRPRLLVLPEGFTVTDLAQQLEAEGLARPAEVEGLASSRSFAQTLGIEADRLEGYLFPDTYQVTKGMRIEEILDRMVERFRERIATAEVLTRARARRLTLHELVTLASIVEKEAVLAEERPIIAAVFWNRLKRGMPLQADPTVAYAVGRAGRAPTREDLQVDHPFNTYRYRGLPPGPIANPGRAAVEAILSPARVPYLYFVSIDDRQHHFSTTLEEHNRAVARYRKQRARGAL